MVVHLFGLDCIVNSCTVNQVHRLEEEGVDVSNCYKKVPSEASFGIQNCTVSRY